MLVQVDGGMRRRRHQRKDVRRHDVRAGHRHHQRGLQRLRRVIEPLRLKNLNEQKLELNEIKIGHN